jgi:hypothetical protein
MNLAFMSIILGNIYRSIITTDMILPYIGTIPYDNFNQLVNFTLFTVTVLGLRVPRESLTPRIKKDGIGENEGWLYESCDLLQYSIYRKMMFEEYKIDEGEYLAMHQDIFDRVRLFEYEEDALASLGSCGTKAFVGSVEEIRDFLKFNGGRVKLGQGKVPLLPHNYYWRIPYFSGGYVQRRMTYLISSGIYHVWEKVYYAKTRDEIEPSFKKTMEMKQSLDTSLMALFKILSWSLSLSVAVFCSEFVLAVLSNGMRLIEQAKERYGI